MILLGIWGALIPFVGPYFHYAFGSFQTWHYTSERLWLCIIPGAVAVIGGLMLLRSSHRSSGLLGGWLALAAGAWFAIGPTISLLWHDAGNPIGAPMGGHTRQALEWLGYFTGLGVLIATLAAFAMGRYFSRPRVVEEAAVAADGAIAADDAVVAEREAPVAGTAAGEPVAEREAPVAGTAAGEPVAAREPEPLAPREPEPVAPPRIGAGCPQRIGAARRARGACGGAGRNDRARERTGGAGRRADRHRSGAGRVAGGHNRYTVERHISPAPGAVPVPSPVASRHRHHTGHLDIRGRGSLSQWPMRPSVRSRRM